MNLQAGSGFRAEPGWAVKPYQRAPRQPLRQYEDTKSFESYEDLGTTIRKKNAKHVGSLWPRGPLPSPKP